MVGVPDNKYSYEDVITIAMDATKTKKRKRPDSCETNITVEFVGQYADRYQRNNKRSGIKNLRCFPRCSTPQHRTQGFCGQPVLVRFQIPKQTLYKYDVKLSPTHFSAVAEFRLSSQGVDPVEGKVLQRDHLLSKQRTKDAPMNPWIPGMQIGYQDLEKDDQIIIEFEFNSIKKGWHYGWVSNKHTCEANHCLRVSLLLSTDDGTFVCIRSASSPEFKIFCRRRSRLPEEDIRLQNDSERRANPLAYHADPANALQYFAPQYLGIDNDGSQSALLGRTFQHAFSTPIGLSQAQLPLALHSHNISSSTLIRPQVSGVEGVPETSLYVGRSNQDSTQSPAKFTGTSGTPLINSCAPCSRLCFALFKAILKLEINEDGALNAQAHCPRSLVEQEVSTILEEAVKANKVELTESTILSALTELSFLNIKIEQPKIQIAFNIARYLENSPTFIGNLLDLQTRKQANECSDEFFQVVHNHLHPLLTSSEEFRTVFLSLFFRSYNLLVNLSDAVSSFGNNPGLHPSSQSSFSYHAGNLTPTRFNQQQFALPTRSPSNSREAATKDDLTESKGNQKKQG